MLQKVGNRLLHVHRVHAFKSRLLCWGLVEVYLRAVLCQELFGCHLCCKSMAESILADARSETLRASDRGSGRRGSARLPGGTCETRRSAHLRTAWQARR